MRGSWTIRGRGYPGYAGAGLTRRRRLVRARQRPLAAAQAGDRTLRAVHRITRTSSNPQDERDAPGKNRTCARGLGTFVPKAHLQAGSRCTTRCAPGIAPVPALKAHSTQDHPPSSLWRHRTLGAFCRRRRPVPSDRARAAARHRDRAPRPRLALSATPVRQEPRWRGREEERTGSRRPGRIRRTHRARARPPRGAPRGQRRCLRLRLGRSPRSLRRRATAPRAFVRSPPPPRSTRTRARNRLRAVRPIREWPAHWPVTRVSSISRASSSDSSSLRRASAVFPPSRAMPREV